MSCFRSFIFLACVLYACFCFDFALFVFVCSDVGDAAGGRASEQHAYSMGSMRRLPEVAAHAVAHRPRAARGKVVLQPEHLGSGEGLLRCESLLCAVLCACQVLQTAILWYRYKHACCGIIIFA